VPSAMMDQTQLAVPTVNHGTISLAKEVRERKIQQ
jgi:hypothetical protein